MSRRDFLLSSAAVALAPGLVRASAYPDRLIKMINPFPSGGTTEILRGIIARGLGLR